MIYIIYIFKILLYILFVICGYRLIKKDHGKYHILVIFVISLMFGFYSSNIIVKEVFDGDRENYVYYFENNMDIAIQQSLGLDFVNHLIYNFTSDPYIYFFFMSFLNMFIGLSACRISKNNDVKTGLYLLTSVFPIVGFYAYKQCIANSFMYVAFALYFNYPIIKNQIGKMFSILLCLLCMFCAFCFHRTAILMAFIMILLYLSNCQKLRQIINIGILLTPFVFYIIQRYLFANIGFLSEELLNRSLSYQDNSGSIGNFMAVLKVMPYLPVLFVSLKYMKSLHTKIPLFYGFCFLLYMMILFHLCAVFNYWYNRFAWYLFYPVFLFVTLIERTGVNTKYFGIKWNNWFYSANFSLSIIRLSQYYFYYGGL